MRRSLTSAVVISSPRRSRRGAARDRGAGRAAARVHTLFSFRPCARGCGSSAPCRDRARDRLPDPPVAYVEELVAPSVVELLDPRGSGRASPWIRSREASAAPRYDFAIETTRRRSGPDHLRLGGHVAALDPLRQVDLLVGGQQRHPADLAGRRSSQRRLDGQVELRDLLPSASAGCPCGGCLCPRPPPARRRGR
jgi:hypothetical protein